MRAGGWAGEISKELGRSVWTALRMESGVSIKGVTDDFRRRAVHAFGYREESMLRYRLQRLVSWSIARRVSASPSAYRFSGCNGSIRTLSRSRGRTRICGATPSSATIRRCCCSVAKLIRFVSLRNDPALSKRRLTCCTKGRENGYRSFRAGNSFSRRRSVRTINVPAAIAGTDRASITGDQKTE